MPPLTEEQKARQKRQERLKKEDAEIRRKQRKQEDATRAARQKFERREKKKAAQRAEAGVDAKSWKSDKKHKPPSFEFSYGGDTERMRSLQIIGLDMMTSSLDSIKRAYRSLARLYHPDKNPMVNTDEQMKKINYAYNYLTQTQ